MTFVDPRAEGSHSSAITGTRPRPVTVRSQRSRERVCSWLPQLTPDAVVAFRDYSDVWPGMKQAIDENLRLTGDVHADVFAWRNGSHSSVG